MTAIAQRKVLVLNRGWTPIDVISVRRAIKLVSCDDHGEPKARIIDVDEQFRLYTWADWSEMMPKDGEPVIRSASRAHRIPEVILLSRYNKLRQQGLRFSRRTIYKRDNNQCQYCGCRPGTAELTLDHVIPRCQGGQTTWENCVVACWQCNSRKAGKTPEQAGMKLLRKPFKPKYHFYRGDYRCKSWEALLGAAYWEVELQNDN